MLTTNLIMSLMLSTTSIAFLSHSPLQMGLCILTMSLLTAMLFAMNLSTWMAFLLFLIYIGGMLIMFSYFIATSPNMKVSLMFILTSFIILTPLFMLLLNMNMFTPFPTITNMMTESTTFYNQYHTPILILMALALLITLIIVVKVSNTSKGPLRPFMNYV